jgi:DNA primase
VRDALHAAGQVIRPRGTDAFMASCPLHSDHTPSLSVAWRESTPAGHSGAVLLHCFSCQAGAADITAALGLRLSDLFDNPVPPAAQNGSTSRQRSTPAPPATRGPLPPRITVSRQPAHHQWRRVRVYTYTTAAGWPVQQVIRLECGCGGRIYKRFQQRYRHGRRWVYRKPEGFTPGLYRAGAIQAAAKAATWVWITEGEKDADTLTSLGRPATTNAQGAASFPAALLAQFTGLHVAIVADRDLAGYQRAMALYQQLHTTAAQVVVLMAGLDSDKADVTDHVNAGLWRADEPFGGLIEVSHADLQALALAASVAQAADRFAIAITEAQAHQALQPAAPASARAAARWLTEAAHQLRTVRRSHRDLQRHTNEHPSPIAATAATTVAALRARIEDTYRQVQRTPPQPTRIAATNTTACGLKEPA